MNRADVSFHRRATRLAGCLLAAAACAWLGWPSMSIAAPPQMAAPPIIVPATAASSNVPVDQSPLTISKPIPPNIVLMLDDSGSMAWDVMPDWSGTGSISHNQIDLTDAKINGVYYNPSVTYTPPPRADGTLYPAPAFSAAPVNGFDTDADRPVVDISSYAGRYDSSKSGANSSNINYSVAFVKSQGSQDDATDDSFDAPEDCPSGTAASKHEPDYCFYSSDPSPTFYEFANPSVGAWYVSKCNKEGFIYNKKTGKCLVKDNVAIVASCPSGVIKLGTTTVGYDDDKDICVTYTADYFFTYSVDGVRHYVGKSGMCADAGLSSDVCVDPSQTTPSDPTVKAGMSGTDVLQNVANWFAYYHTRILLAKTGVMRAFSNLNETYRLGFASINANAKGSIPTSPAPYVFNDYTSGGGDKFNKLAVVQAFGSGADATSQKSNFWKWIANESASGNTPLRKALDAVGSYYSTEQPWASKGADPDQTDYLACRQAYVILTTDGFWNGASPSVGNEDGKAGAEITGPNNNSAQYKPVAPFMDDTATSDTLADVAMKYWKADLMPSTGTPAMANEVPTSDADPAFWQHMVTFTMGMGYTPKDADSNLIYSDATKAPAGSITVQALFDWAQSSTKPSSLASWGGWPVPSSGDVNNITDLVHAGLNGHGGFYSATDPESFIGGLKNALQRAQERTGTGASLAANSTELNTGTMIYQGVYHTKSWKGNLIASPVDSVTGAINSTATWNAAGAMPAAADRDIHTYVPAGSTWSASTGSYIEFKNSSGDPSATPAVPAAPPSLSAGELAALGGDSAQQMAMVDYLRGDESQDQSHKGPFRDRDTALGDIVDSQPVYVGAPAPYVFSGQSFSGSNSYAAFATTQKNRAGLVYVAADDGMLHAFDAATGVEKYAYLPAAVITRGGVDEAGNVVGVSELANPDYGLDVSVPHQFFNDGLLTIAAAYFDSAWHTVLVGTTGRGMAKAVYALDVTDPTDIKFLWERSAGDGGGNSDYIGQMVGQPVIAQVADGKWVVLIGNGYNSAKGVAALLQFSLSDGTLAVYKTSDSTTGNGLAAPAVWIGNSDNGLSTVAYAGDLHGQVWSFPLSATATSSGTELFVAKDSNGKAQPITAGMLAGQDPSTGNRWIFFGTGRYLSADDITDLNVQSWYGLIVDSSTPGLAVTSATTRSKLAQRFIIAQTAGDANTNPPVLPARVVSPLDGSATPITGKSGWYIDLETPGMDADNNATDYADPVAEGERMVTPNQFKRGELVSTTRIPKSDDLCNPSGSGWVMAVNPFTGTNPKPQFFDINSDGVINSTDMVQVGGKYYPAAGVGYSSLVNGVTFIGSAAEVSLVKGPKTESTVPSSGEVKRVSWREMVNP